MYEVFYQVFGRRDRIETRRKGFRSEPAMTAFVAKLTESGKLYRICAYSYPD
jgi:hypothetical protein